MTIDAEQLLFFAAAFALMVASPGPFVASIAARAMAFGFRSGAMLALGGALADAVYVCLAAFGLTAIAEAHGWALEILRYIGAAWLIWIGIHLFRARSEAVEPDVTIPLVRDPPWRAFATGALLNLGNPKAALFYMALFPGFFDMSGIGWLDVIAILCVTIPIGLASDCAYAAAAHRARRLLRDARAIRNLNRGTGGVMIGAGVAIAAT